MVIFKNYTQWIIDTKSIYLKIIYAKKKKFKTNRQIKEGKNCKLEYVTIWYFMACSDDVNRKSVTVKFYRQHKRKISYENKITVDSSNKKKKTNERNTQQSKFEYLSIKSEKKRKTKSIDKTTKQQKKKL